MNKYATDCAALDSARHRAGAEAESLRKWLEHLDRCLKAMYGHAMSPWALGSIMEQREKVLMLHDILVDFNTYLDTAEAWAPALPEPGFDFPAQASAAMDGLLGAIGPEVKHG